MSGQFAHRTIAITGAAGGIGRALCRHFAKEGAAIVALDKSSGVAEMAETMQADGLSVRSMAVDIGAAEAVREAFTAAADIDVLINNAGYSNHTPLPAPIPLPGRRSSTAISTAPSTARMRCCRGWWPAGAATSSPSPRSTA